MGGSGLSVIITQAHDDRLCVLHHFRYVDYLLAFLSLNADPHTPPVMHSPQRIIKALRHSPRGLTSFQHQENIISTDVYGCLETARNV